MNRVRVMVMHHAHVVHIILILFGSHHHYITVRFRVIAFYDDVIRFLLVKVLQEQGTIFGALVVTGSSVMPWKYQNILLNMLFFK